MKVLFTKIIEDDIALKQIKNLFSCHFLEVIKTHQRKISSYPLTNKSLIFTSVNGVESFFENGFRPNEDFFAKNFNKIYAVGVKTKQALRKNGFGTFKTFSCAAEMSEFITHFCNRENFIHFCGNISLNILEKELPLQNIKYKKEVLYDTEQLYPVYTEDYDAVVFFSPSGVRSFIQHNCIDGKILFAIGKTTETELKKMTQEKVYYSKKNSLTDLLKIIEHKLLEFNKLK